MLWRKGRRGEEQRGERRGAEGRRGEEVRSGGEERRGREGRRTRAGLWEAGLGCLGWAGWPEVALGIKNIE